MAEHRRAQIRDDAFAERDDEIVAQRARHRENAHDHDQHGEIVIDQPTRLVGEAVIDHAPHRERNHEGGRRRADQGGECRRDAPAVGERIGNERRQRAQIGFRAVRFGCGHGARLISRISSTTLPSAGAAEFARPWRSTSGPRRGPLLRPSSLFQRGK
jgi:hypothetical protein